MSAQVPANTIGFFIAQSAEEVKRWALLEVIHSAPLKETQHSLKLFQSLVLLQSLPRGCEGRDRDTKV